MKRILSLPLGATAALSIDEDGPTAILRLSVNGEVSVGTEGKLSPEAAVAVSRALGKFALRHLPEAQHEEISDGIPTMSPAYETTDVNVPVPPSRVSG